MVPKAREKHIHLSAVDETDGACFLVDTRRLKQALINLVANAVKFSHKQGWIVVRATVERDGLVLAVTDNGIGIATSEIRTIFKPFVRVASNMVREYDGIGLGLAITKEIVEAHGGSIGVESELGRGSTFSLRLPDCRRPSTQPTASKHPASTAAACRREHAA
jgi:signal transduction histidine kinase